MTTLNIEILNFGRKYMQLCWKFAQCKPVFIFILLLVLSIFADIIDPYLTIWLVFATYLSGVFLVLWGITLGIKQFLKWSFIQI